MPKLILLRDDDICYFTQPQHLQRLYSRLWDHDIPVTLATIPAIWGDTRVRHRLGAPHDPAIDRVYRGTERAYPLAENVALCDFLHAQVLADKVDVALHGFHHRYMECAYLQTPKAYALVHQGRTVLETHLPGLRIGGFIAPYDAMSLDVLYVAQTLGMNVCTSTRNVAKAFPTQQTYQAQRTPLGRVLVTCDEYLFNHRDAPQRCLELALARLANPAVEVLTISNHYWSFFYDWAGENTGLLRAWDAFVEALLARTDVTFVTLSQIDPQR